jgi:ribosome maturation factor RimP
MKNEVENKVKQFAKPIVKDLGYELVDVEYEEKENGMNLTLFIDSKDGINLKDCELVSNKLNQPLDELNPTNDESYNFNVSSVGLDRPLKTVDDFLRNINTELEITYNSAKGEKTIKGVLKNVEGNKLKINQKGKPTTLEIEQVVKALPVIEF